MDAPRGRPAGRGRCWHVYRSLHQARLHAEAAAGSELAASGGHAGPRVHDVEVLEQLVRELWFVGPADALRVLATNQAMLDRLAADQPLEAAAGAPAPATAAAAGAGLTVVNGLARSTAEEIFRRLDRTGSGFIDRGDLMAGLGLLGQHVDLSDIEQICLELGTDTGARVDMQTFCDIVEAQRLMVPGSDATFLRHLHAARPEWWSDAPGYIANAS